MRETVLGKIKNQVIILKEFMALIALFMILYFMLLRPTKRFKRRQVFSLIPFTIEHNTIHNKI